MTWLLTSWTIDECDQGTEYLVVFHVANKLNIICLLQSSGFFFLNETSLLSGRY